MSQYDNTAALYIYIDLLLCYGMDGRIIYASVVWSKKREVGRSKGSLSKQYSLKFLAFWV